MRIPGPMNSLAHLFRVMTCATAIFLSAAPAISAENHRPIGIVLNTWTSQIVMAKITGTIFESLGYKVRYHQVSADNQWGGLHRGQYHVQVEIWEGTMKEVFQRMVETGGMVDAGSHDAKTREEWWYPAYVEKECPGLPHWTALKECYPLFATPETRPRGRYLAGPWEKPDRARIRALGLPFKAIEVETADALRIELEKAIANKSPILLFNWSPNWVEARHEGKFIEFPDYDPKCETDPSWGINPNFPHDCGNPKRAWLKKGAWAGMPDTWPCAYQTLLQINFTNAMIAQFSLMVDVHKMSHDAATERWLNENKALWTSWIPGTCAKPHPDRDRGAND